MAPTLFRRNYPPFADIQGYEASTGFVVSGHEGDEFDVSESIGIDLTTLKDLLGIWTAASSSEARIRSCSRPRAATRSCPGPIRSAFGYRSGELGRGNRAIL